MIPATHFEAFRFCPRCASEDWDAPSPKQFVCRTCDFHYFSNAAAAVIAIIRNAAGELLMTRRGREPERGKLDFPGGFVDPQESIETALTREVREEVGIEIEKAAYLASFPNRYVYRGVLYHTIDLVFVCDSPTAAPASDRDEIDEILFFAPDAIPREEIGFESVRNAVEFYCQTVRREE